MFFTVPRFTLAVNRSKAGISSHPSQAAFAELRKLIVQLPASSRMCINLFLNMVLQPKSLQRWFSQIGQIARQSKNTVLDKDQKAVKTLKRILGHNQWHRAGNGLKPIHRILLTEFITTQTPNTS